MIGEKLRKASVAKTQSLRDAMTALDSTGLEIVLVVGEEGRLEGALTDGDIRRALLGGASIDSDLGPFVRERITCVTPETSRAEVLDIMRARTFAQVPIVDENGRLVGLHLLREIIGAVKRPNWAVVMAGGRGERLRPITDTVPKPMVQVAGRPILERIVLHLVGCGITKVFLAINYMGDLIKDHFGDGSSFGCEVEYLEEEQPLGTGGALSLLPRVPEHPLVVLNGDLLTQIDLGSMLGFHESGGFKASIGLREYVHRVPYGVVELTESHVSNIREKPSHVWTANCGIYVIQPDLLSRIPRGEYFGMPDLMGDCLTRGEPVGGYMVEGDWIDIGGPGALQRARGEDAEL